MQPAFRHLGRAFEIARCLARHDALRLLDGVPLPFAARCALGGFRRIYGRRRPALRDGEALAAALAELGPAFIKLGQVLSVRPDLVGDALAEDLGHLRDRLPAFGWKTARAQLEAELGAPAAQLFAAIDPEPVAAASVAQVHRARRAVGASTADAGAADAAAAAAAAVADAADDAVAVKLLRPGVEAAFARDLALFGWLAALAERHVPGMARLKPGDVVQLVQQQVMIELDLRFEAAAAAELAEQFRNDPDVVIPAVDWARTSRRVLTLAWLEGTRIEERAALAAAGHDLAALARRVIQMFLRQALEHGYFHADLHHGNVFVLADGRLGLVDFGIMGRISLRDRRFLAEMLGAFLAGDWQRAADVHFEAGYVPADRDRALFAQACRAIGEPIRGKPVHEISIGRLLAQLFQVTETFGMPTQPHLLLLQKTMVTVEGVARGLDPQVNFWEAAHPIVTSWAARNLGPEALLEDLAKSAAALVRQLPALLARLEQNLSAASGFPGAASGASQGESPCTSLFTSPGAKAATPAPGRFAAGAGPVAGWIIALLAGLLLGLLL